MENTNRQTWILTTYGLRRITEAMQSPTTERIYLTKLIAGDANGTYYTPIQGVDEDLRHKIVVEGTRVTFPIIEKSIDDITVTLRSFISETSGGYTIRELGLYETVNGIDYCFALGTFEPIVKPAYSTEDNYGYAVSIDYKLNINSVNLASVYDQIILDSDNEYVTKEELETLSRTVLFVEGNLMDQISTNTHLLGLNRAQQLNELIENTQSAYANASLTSLYTNIINAVGSSSVKGFWGFNYVEKYDSLVAVKDFSPYGNNLNLNKPISGFETGNLGLIPYVNFTSSDYFYAPYVSSLKMSSAFSIIFTGSYNVTNDSSTILAQSNSFTNKHNWSVLFTVNKALEVKVYTDSSNYKVFKSVDNILPSKTFTLIVCYDSGSVTAYINGVQIALVEQVTGTYISLNQENLDTTSYLINSSGQRVGMINSKVSGLFLLSTSLSKAVARAISLSLRALSGENIYRGS